MRKLKCKKSYRLGLCIYNIAVDISKLYCIFLEW